MYGKTKSGIALPVRVEDSTGVLKVSGSALQEATLAGRVFAAANQAPVTTVAGCTAAAWTGLGVANPTGSGINVIIHQFGWTQYVVATGEGVLGLATCPATGFAAGIATRNRFGGGIGKAYADDGATLAEAGVIEQWVTTITHGAATVTYGLPVNVLNLMGSLVLPPGRAVITVTDIVQTTVLAFSFLWEEVPV